MTPKDKDNICQRSTVIYWCPHTECPEYTGESGRIFGDRFQEHLRALCLIYQHSHTAGHPVNLECFTIVDRKSQGVTSTIKEAIYIHVCYPSLNRILGKYQLPHIWDEVLLDTPSLHLK